MATGRGSLENSIYGDRQGGHVIDTTGLSVAERITADPERLQRYRDYWRIYRGDHWDYSRGQGGNPESQSLVTLNYGRRIVDVHVNFLMKNGWETKIPDDPETASREDIDRSFIKDRLDKVWKLNDRALFNFEFAQVGSVTGDAFARVFWDSEIDAPRVEVIPSQLVYPEYTGAGSRRRMAKCTILRDEVRHEKKLTLRGYRNVAESTTIREVWTAEKRELWEDDTLILSEPCWAGEIPIVHTINYPIAGEPYGLSDLHTIYDLQKLINETTTDIKDIIEYYGSPVTVVSGARVSELERGAGKVWAVPKDAKVDNLQLDGDLAASHKFLETLMEAAFNLSGTPKAALGGDFRVTGTSGATLAMTFMPMLEIRNVKTRTYGEGLRKINRLMLKACELKDTEFLRKMAALPAPGRYMTEVVFNSPLPRDEANTLETSIRKISAGMSTRRRELVAWGMSESEADNVLSEWAEEQATMAQAEFDLGKFIPEQERSGNPNPVRPNTNVQGQAVADRAANREIGEPEEEESD